MSAVTRLMPKPPARVVRRKMNFSLSGLLYSSMATIRSSCAVPPSIRQYSIRSGLANITTICKHWQHTVSTEQAVVFENVQHTTHLTENEYAGTFRLHASEKFVKNDQLARVFNKVFVSGVGRPRFLEQNLKTRYGITIDNTHCSVKKIWMTSDFTQLHDHVHEACLAFLLASKT